MEATGQLITAAIVPLGKLVTLDEPFWTW